MRRRRHLEHERRRRLGRAERAGHLVGDRRQALEVGRNGHRVLLGHLGKGVPGHDRRQDPAVRPRTGLDGLDDVVGAPPAEAGFIVRGEVRAVKHAQLRDVEADLGPAEIAGHVGFPEKIPRRMAVGAKPKRDQVLSTLDLIAARRLGPPGSNGGENKTGNGGTGKNGDAQAIGDDAGRARFFNKSESKNFSVSKKSDNHDPLPSNGHSLRFISDIKYLVYLLHINFRSCHQVIP